VGFGQFEYGIRQGLPRLLKLFREFGWQWTTWACARAFETSGDYPKMLVEDGHEIACHGNRWRIHGTNSAQEKAHINKSFDRLQASTGLPNVPTGWFLGNGSIRQKLVRAQVSEIERFSRMTARTSGQVTGGLRWC
jgi:peptidoglycan/xylan/chitin deacetylase (PgdA/CDA1 family)